MMMIHERDVICGWSLRTPEKNARRVALESIRGANGLKRPVDKAAARRPR